MPAKVSLHRIILTKFKESLFSVTPVVALVCILYLTPLVSLTARELTVFLLSSVVLIIGMTLFNLGADMAMTPMGEHIGAGLTRSRKITALLTVCFLMGVFITVAEPDLQVLASQIAGVVSSTMLIVTVGFGVGLFLLMAVLKMLFHKPLSSMLMFFYMTLFALTALVVVNGNVDFLPMAFDSGGVTTHYGALYHGTGRRYRRDAGRTRRRGEQLRSGGALLHRSHPGGSAFGYHGGQR